MVALQGYFPSSHQPFLTLYPAHFIYHTLVTALGVLWNVMLEFLVKPLGCPGNFWAVDIDANRLQYFTSVNPKNWPFNEWEGLQQDWPKQRTLNEGGGRVGEKWEHLSPILEKLVSTASSVTYKFCALSKLLIFSEPQFSHLINADFNKVITQIKWGNAWKYLA